MPLYETENITCVEPADYPASRVSWTNDNAQVRFIGGSTGAEVCVWALGSAGTYSRLSLAVRASTSYGHGFSRLSFMLALDTIAYQGHIDQFCKK